MKAFETSFENVIYRFCLMMAVIIVGFFVGQPLLALLALPLFLSAALGLEFKKEQMEIKEASVFPIRKKKTAA